MPGFSDSQLIAKANALGAKTEEESISPEYLAGILKDLIDSKYNKDNPLPKGDEGKSAYQVWLDEGNEGTEADFLLDIKGDKGDDGDAGDTGQSTYQVWLGEGNEGTEADFLLDIKGDKGDEGDAGDAGQSAYQVWLSEGNEGTEADFLLDIKGDKGDEGDAGDAGQSAYQVWLSEGNEGTEADFLLDIKGDKGDDGDAGDTGQSAYQIWLGEGNEGTEQDFIASLQGSPDTGSEIVDKLSGLDPEDQLPIEKIKNGQVIVNSNTFELDEITGEVRIKSVFPVQEGNEVTFARRGKFGSRLKPIYFDFTLLNAGDEENSVILYLTSDTVPDLINSPPSYLDGNITGTFSTDLDEVNRILFTRVDADYMTLVIENLPNGDNDPQLLAGTYLHLELEDEIDPLPEYIVDSGTAVDLGIEYINGSGGTTKEPGPVDEAMGLGQTASSAGSHLQIALANLANAAFMDLLADGFTVMFWAMVKPGSTTTSRSIIGANNTSTLSGFDIKSTSGGQIYLLVAASGNSDDPQKAITDSSNKLENDGVWSHWGIRYDRINTTGIIKKNNVQAGTGALNTSLVVDNATKFVVPDLDVLIGNGRDGSRFEIFLDDVFIIPRPLSDAEMTRIYERGDLTGL